MYDAIRKIWPGEKMESAETLSSIFGKRISYVPRRQDGNVGAQGSCSRLGFQSCLSIAKTMDIRTKKNLGRTVIFVPG